MQSNPQSLALSVLHGWARRVVLFAAVALGVAVSFVLPDLIGDRSPRAAAQPGEWPCIGMLDFLAIPLDSTLSIRGAKGDVTTVTDTEGQFSTPEFEQVTVRWQVTEDASRLKCIWVGTKLPGDPAPAGGASHLLDPGTTELTIQPSGGPGTYCLWIVPLGSDARGELLELCFDITNPRGPVVPSDPGSAQTPGPPVAGTGTVATRNPTALWWAGLVLVTLAAAGLIAWPRLRRR